jgi:hypothetical protein
MMKAVFVGNYYVAERMFPKFWSWQVLGGSRFVVQSDGLPRLEVVYTDLTKDAAMGYVKLLMENETWQT